MKILKTLSAVFVLVLSTSSHAALVERLGGLAYYDDVADLTWLADANAAGTTMNWDDAQCTSTFINPEPLQSGNNQDYLMQVHDSGVSSGDTHTTSLTMVRLEDGRR